MKSLQFFLLIETSHELHEDPSFVPTIVHEEVVDLVQVFVSLMSTTISLYLDSIISFNGTSSVIIGLERVLLSLCLTISENLLSLSIQKNPDLFIF